MRSLMAKDICNEHRSVVHASWSAEQRLLFLEANDENIVIVDESTSIKNRSANRTKNIMQLKGLSKYRRILTGSPVTRSPMDLYSQCMFLSVLALNFKSFFAFSKPLCTGAKAYYGPTVFQ